MRYAIGAILLLACAAGARADDGHDLPVFDAHMHYKQPAWEPYPPASVLELMDRNGVAMALVSSTPDEGTIRLWQYAPARIVPELRPYHGDAGSGTWTKAPGMLTYLAGRLERYPHQGIGEFHIHQIDPEDQDFLRAVAILARKHEVPIHIHSGAAPVRLFYRLEPSLTVIWAHAGMSEPPAVIGAMMDEFATLHADTSYREHEILAGDAGLDADWRALLIRHADRFMLGTDTWVNSQWDDYDGLIALSRRILAGLPRPVAEKIAYGNAERLFGRRVAPALIGKR